jgi:hypothetical protein
MPVLSAILSLFFLEIQTTGLFASAFVYPPQRKIFRSRVGSHLGPFFTMFSLAEKHFGARMKVHSTPILYNSMLWTHTQILGGYIIRNLDIKASELCRSYLACWLGAAHGRLLKAAIWYVKRKGNFEAGLDYLSDLFEAGYVMSTDEFAGDGLILVNLYFKLEQPLKFIDKLPLIIDPASTNEMLAVIDKAIADKTAKEERVVAVYTRILNRLLDRITSARNAESLGDYVLLGAKIAGLYRLLRFIVETHKSVLKLTLANEAILSQIEEISADFGAVNLTFLTNPKHFPLVQDPLRTVFDPHTMNVARSYIHEYGSDGVEKFFEDRLLVPKYLKQIYRNKLSKNKSYIPLKNFSDPKEWKYFPYSFAHLFGILKEIVPSLMRAKLIDKRIIFSEILESQGKSLPKGEVRSIIKTYVPSLMRAKLIDKRIISSKIPRSQRKYSLSKSELRSIIKTQYSPYGVSRLLDEYNRRNLKTQEQKISNHFYTNYSNACVKEKQSKFFPLLLDPSKFIDQTDLSNRLFKLEALSDLYPWDPFIYNEMCVYSDYMGDKKKRWKT